MFFFLTSGPRPLEGVKRRGVCDACEIEGVHRIEQTCEPCADTVAARCAPSVLSSKSRRNRYDDNLQQPVAVQSFYLKSSDEAEWGMFSDARRASSRVGAGDVGVPAGTRPVGTQK